MIKNYKYKIKIDASVEDDGNRLARINQVHRVIGYAQALADIHEDFDLLNKIENIFNKKGVLTITWRKSPLDIDKEYIGHAWKSSIADYSNNTIKHIVIKKTD